MSETDGEVQSSFQLWEVGGGQSMARLVDVCLKPEQIMSAFAVIVLDLEKAIRLPLLFFKSTLLFLCSPGVSLTTLRTGLP